MRALLLALALFVAAPAVAQVATLEPVDEAAADPSFVLFRARLLEAVAVRDTAFVLAHLHPDVKISFGGDDGVEGFRRIWLEDRPQPTLWTELATFLPFGSTYDADIPGASDEIEARATVPYWFGVWPNDFDAFEHVLIIGENVNVRAAPDLEAAVVAQLSHAVVRAESGLGAEPWIGVVLGTGEVGYVAHRFVRSPIGYRVGFEKVDGRWQITFFVAGD